MQSCTSIQWRLFIFISRESKWGTLQSAGNPRCAVPAEIHSICSDRPRPGPAAGLQVSPTSDTSQSVAILMNRPHCAHGWWRWWDDPELVSASKSQLSSKSRFAPFSNYIVYLCSGTWKAMFSEGKQNNSVRCGKRQDTISDKRGIHKTRLTRHNRCG